MKLMSALNSFLNQFYISAAPPGQAEQGISAHEFYDLVIARAVQSDDFRARLLSDPDSVLAELGIQLPAGVQINFVENTDQLVHIVIPPYIGD